MRASRPFGGGAVAGSAPTRRSLPSAPSLCLIAALAALAVTWYGITAVVLAGCDNQSGGDGAPLVRIGAVAMAGVRKTVGRMQASDMVVDENVMVAHAARRPGSRGAAAAAAAVAAAEAAAAAAPAATPRVLAESTLEDPRIKSLTARLVHALRLEEAGGAGAAGAEGVEGVAGALARAVLAAEASGVDMAVGPKDAAGASAPKPAAEAEGSAPPGEYTQQTCYLQTDESEVCVYDGVLCYDGVSPIVSVDEPVREPERIVDYTHSCSDFRYYEPSAMEYSGCAYTHPFERKYSYDLPIQPASDFPLPLRRRRWGPQNRNGHLYFKEVTPSEIWGAPTGDAADGRASGNPGITGAVEGPRDVSPSGRWASTLVTDTPFPFDTGFAKDLRIVKRTRVGNRTIDWVDGHLWLAGIDGQFWQNPYHWWSKIGCLYDAQRSNATPGFMGHPDDGWLQHRRAGEITSSTGSISRQRTTNNRMSFKQGAQWDLPPMDYVLFTGDGAVVLEGVHKLNPWFRGTLELASQPHTKHFFNDVLGQLSNWRYLCTRRAGMLGVKNKIFTGRADAWLWRHYAYKALGLGAKGHQAHPRYPPRKVTIIDRKGLNGRGIYNKDEIIAAVAATGLPYQVVPNMASMSFAEQVELIAGTGILIAPHGAHLTNSMFLPVHAVVIELFPYLLKKNTYRHLASLADLSYFPVYSWELLSPMLNTTFYGVALMQEKYYWDNCVKTNITSYEALMVHACNAMSKNYPIVVQFPQFHLTLKDAIDTIGAYSLANPAWEKIAEKEGQPVPSPPASANRPDRFGIFG